MESGGFKQSGGPHARRSEGEEALPAAMTAISRSRTGKPTQGTHFADSVPPKKRRL